MSEGEPLARKDVLRMMDLALAGVETLTQIQEKVLIGAGVDLAKLMIPVVK